MPLLSRQQGEAVVDVSPLPLIVAVCRGSFKFTAGALTLVNLARAIPSQDGEIWSGGAHYRVLSR